LDFSSALVNLECMLLESEPSYNASIRRWSSNYWELWRRSWCH